MKAIVSTTDALIIETQLPPNQTNAAVPASLPGPQDPLVLSYLALRKAVGIIGFALPFVLALVNMILLRRVAVESSISSYYYTDMGNVFVGSLCAIGVFLMSTRGYDHTDEIAGRLACAFALGVALFPTSPDNATSTETLIGGLHWASAALLFVTLAYFCLALFRKTAPDRIPTRRKIQRNAVYRFCGRTILASIFLIGVIAIGARVLPSLKPLVVRFSPNFWLESIAVIAFGVAWLTKGETILKDK